MEDIFILIKNTFLEKIFYNKDFVSIKELEEKLIEYYYEIDRLTEKLEDKEEL